LKLSFVSLLTGICTTELLAYALIVQRSGCDSTHESEAMDDAANFQAWHAIALILFLARDSSMLSSPFIHQDTLLIFHSIRPWFLIRHHVYMTLFHSGEIGRDRFLFIRRVSRARWPPGDVAALERRIPSLATLKASPIDSFPAFGINASTRLL